MTLGARIYAGFAVVLLAFGAVGAIVVVAQRARLIDQLDNQLETVVPLSRRAPQAPGGGGETPLRPAANDQSEAPPISDLFIAALSSDGTIDTVVQGQLLNTIPVIDAQTATSATGRRFDTLASGDGSTEFRVLIEPANGVDEIVVVGLPMSDVNDSIRQLIITFVLLGAFVAAVLGVLAWWIARLGLRPISEMTATATTIAAGDRDQRVAHLDDRTEAGQLGAAFNQMLDERDLAEDRLRRFVSDASHELRTPLTSVRGYLDLYSQGGFREPGQLDDAVRRMQSETSRMTGLVEDLLELARLDEEQPLQRSRFDLGVLVQDVVADSGVAHPDRQISAEVDADLPPVSLDRHKVKQLVTGLVSNALTHGPDASVVVRGRTNAGHVEVVVADDGPGLTAEQAGRVFERFYRGDPARARSSGGSGLGLAIAQSIAHAHGGSIALVTSPGDGCEFTVRFPID